LLDNSLLGTCTLTGSLVNDIKFTRYFFYPFYQRNDLSPLPALIGRDSSSYAIRDENKFDSDFRKCRSKLTLPYDSESLVN